MKIFRCILATMAMVVLGSVSVFAEGTINYSIDSIGVKVDIPDDISIITRKSASGDNGRLSFGYESEESWNNALQDMKEKNIYLRGKDANSNYEISIMGIKSNIVGYQLKDFEDQVEIAKVSGKYDEVADEDLPMESFHYEVNGRDVIATKYASSTSEYLSYFVFDISAKMAYTYTIQVFGTLSSEQEQILQKICESASYYTPIQEETEAPTTEEVTTIAEEAGGIMSAIFNVVKWIVIAVIVIILFIFIGKKVLTMKIAPKNVNYGHKDVVYEGRLKRIMAGKEETNTEQHHRPSLIDEEQDKADKYYRPVNDDYLSLKIDAVGGAKDRALELAKEDIVSNEPAIEEPVVAYEEPVVEEPVVAYEEPVVEEPVVAYEEPVVEEPVVAYEEPVVEEPVVAYEEPVVEEPVVAYEEPVVEEPVVAYEEPVVEEPVVEEPVVEEPVVAYEEPVVEEPVVAYEEPVVEEPVVAYEEPVVEEPVVEEPVVAYEEPVVEEPVVAYEEPVVEEPVIEEPVAPRRRTIIVPDGPEDEVIASEEEPEWLTKVTSLEEEEVKNTEPDIFRASDFRNRVITDDFYDEKPRFEEIKESFLTDEPSNKDVAEGKLEFEIYDEEDYIEEEKPDPTDEFLTGSYTKKTIDDFIVDDRKPSTAPKEFSASDIRSQDKFKEDDEKEKNKKPNSNESFLTD